MKIFKTMLMVTLLNISSNILTIDLNTLITAETYKNAGKNMVKCEIPATLTVTNIGTLIMAIPAQNYCFGESQIVDVSTGIIAAGASGYVLHHAETKLNQLDASPYLGKVGEAAAWQAIGFGLCLATVKAGSFLATSKSMDTDQACGVCALLSGMFIAKEVTRQHQTTSNLPTK